MTALALMPDGKHLISGCRGGRISCWPARPAASRWVIPGSENPVHDFAFGGNGCCVVLARDKTIETWDLDTRNRQRKWAEDGGPWLNVAMSPARNVLLAGNENGRIVAWQMETCQQLADWNSPDSVAWENITVAPDGHTFAATAWDRLEEAWLFDLDAPTWQQKVPAYQSDCAVFSPNSKSLVVAWMDDALLYSLETYQALRRFQGHSSTLCGAAFSPDGKILATVGHDRMLRLWQTESATEKYAIVAHRDWIRSVAFAPDGWSLATAGDDGIVRLWHADTGQLLLELPHESDGILRVEFGPDGRRIVCHTSDDCAILYDSLRPQERATTLHAAPRPEDVNQAIPSDSL